MLVILLATVVLFGLEGVTHISILDFLLLWDPTVLPYPLSYSESESLELLYSWQSFFFCELFWLFLTAFSSFGKRSMNCAKELEWSFLPLPWLFCPMVTFLWKPFIRVPTALTSITGRLRAPIFLAQRRAFLNFCLFGNAKFVGISTLLLTFSGDFLSTFLHGLFLGIGTCYYFFDVLKNAQ